MKIIEKLRIDVKNIDEILLKLRKFNYICNEVSEIAYSEHIFYWLKLQRRIYRIMRDKYNLSSAEICAITRKVAYAYKIKENRAILAKFSAIGSMPLVRHVYRDGIVKFYGISVPIINYKEIELPRYPKQAILVYKGEKLFIHQAVDIAESSQYDITGWLGCDLGIKNILTDSDGKIYSGGHLNNLRKRNIKIRSKLQSINSRSCRRLLNKRRNKEHRFARDINHQISKNVVEKANRATLGIVLEDLQGIRDSTKVRKADRSAHSCWGFYQLRRFIEYKAKLKGVSLALVDPRNTSRTCPICGCVDKRNRKKQAWFKCIKCGYGHHADTVAAINISRRADSNQPYAPSSREAVQIPIKRKG